MMLILVLAVPGWGNPQTDGQNDSAFKESATKNDQPAAYSLEELKQARPAVENALDLTEDEKTHLLAYIDRAIFFFEKENQLKAEAQDVANMIEAVPARIKAIEVELTHSPPPPENIDTLTIGMTSDQIEQRLREMETEFHNASEELSRLTEQLDDLKDLPANLQQNITNAKLRLQEIDEELKAVSLTNDSQKVKNALYMALVAEKAKIQAEIKTHQIRLRTHATLTALVSAERDLTARRLSRQAPMVKNWQARVQQGREQEAEKERKAAEQAKTVIKDLPAPIQKEFDVNIELGKLLEQVTADEASIAESLERQQHRLKQLEEAFALAREQVRYPMHTETVGLALREQRRELPDIKDFRRESIQRQVKMGEIRSRQLDFDRQRQALANPDQTIGRLLVEISLPVDANIDGLKADLRRLLSDRRGLIKKLQAGYRRLFKDLQELEYIEQQIAAEARQEAEFLDEHLLWYRSGKSISLQDLRNVPQALQWLFSPHNWRQVVQDLWQTLLGHPFRWVLVLLISFTAMALHRWSHQYLSQVALKVYSIKTDTFVLTLQALVVTLRVGLGWPLLMVFIGWQLGQLSLAPEFTQSVAQALPLTGWTLAAGLFVFELCRKDGVAKVHFKWSERGRQTLRRSLPWLMLALAMMSFVFIMVESKKDPVYMDSLGRLVLMLIIGGLSLWDALKIRQSGPQLLLLTHRKSQLKRLSFLWHFLAIGIPLWLVILAGRGFYYTTFALYMRTCQTIVLILGLVILKDLVLRWIYIVQRRLSFEEKKRKNAALAENPDQGEPTGAVGGEGMVVEEPEINLDQLYEKNKALLETLLLSSALIGLWIIWANVLPALNFLQNIELWHYNSVVDGVSTMVPITLANLMVAVIVVIVTAVAAKNLPGLLEIILINWFPLDRGLRYAISTIFNYAIIATGGLAALGIIGIKWSNFQWLIAALGVGIGFGLQEVVANFICGLIVLFERPYRIGDTVTIGDVSGTVTRIKIRATTIMDWDRKELIVPNKEFIVGRLINWSLSDDIIRIRIPVGIAYGSDTAMAEKLLLKASESNPIVLKSPAPQAVFKGFGDSSLDFEVRVFINGIDDWIPMLHAMNKAIDQAFRKAGVSISFPQRDVHLDQVGPLEVRVVANGEGME